MAVTLNASTSTGYIQTADTSGSLALQSNGTTQFNVTSTGAYGQLKSGTAVTTTSGTSIEFTSIPSWVKRITVMFSAVSTSSSGVIQVQLGDSVRFEITGYAGQTWQANTSNATLSTGFSFGSTSSAGSAVHGNVVLTLIGSNLWACSGILGRVTGADMLVTGGSKTLSDTLTQVRVIASATGSPSDTFDAGTINILYEG